MRERAYPFTVVVAVADAVPEVVVGTVAVFSGSVIGTGVVVAVAATSAVGVEDAIAVEGVGPVVDEISRRFNDCDGYCAVAVSQ